MKILALDYGTNTGYCYGETANSLTAGTWKLATPKEVTAWRQTRRDRTKDPRITRLRDYLRQFPLADLVVFEDVEFSSYTKQTQLWSALRVAAWLDYPDNVKFECVPVGTLKKFATGAGNATKEMMADALAQATDPLPDFSMVGMDDNTVDAVWIWLWAHHNLSRLTSSTR